MTRKKEVGNAFSRVMSDDEAPLLSASTGNFIAKVKWKVGGARLRRTGARLRF